ncbi:MAG: transcriptional regulator [Anaerolineales bacterium]|nr:PLDc_N domain-containing protein [Anaerolineae bacterium]PWB56285.1 MAG: transcriptional regulator [Anaerolineales bacterium]
MTLGSLTDFLPYLIPVLLLEWVLMIIAIMDLIRRERTRGLPKWAWALIVIFIQIFGPIVYLIFGREE